MKNALTLAVLGCLFFPTHSFAHGGGLDAYGCHYNRKRGGYHCHKGALAGMSFPGQKEMLQFLQSSQPDTDKEQNGRQGNGTGSGW